MLASEIGEMLRAKGLTLAVAESCTGGKLGDLITNMPGSSDYFAGGVIAYSNDAKEKFLGVSKKSLETEGAVSEDVARQMASGARKAFMASIGVGITGIAGPTGATPTKPVGLVFVAVSSNDRTVCLRSVFKGGREDVKAKAADEALRLLRNFLRERA